MNGTWMLCLLVGLVSSVSSYAIQRDTICEEKCEKEQTGSEELGRCVRTHHHVHDDMLSTSTDYMENLKCCFQNLTVCIAKVEAKEAGFTPHKCSFTMIQCVVRGDMESYRKQSPPPLRALFKKYGNCKAAKKNRLKHCMDGHYDEAEELMGLDCLNKLVHCTYHWKEDNIQGKGEHCLNSWSTCMVPTCVNPTDKKFKTKIINKIWACKKNKVPGDVTDRHVIDTLKCVLEISRNSGTPMSYLLSREHVREGCFLVYGGDNMTGTTAYERCVNDNVVEHKKKCRSRSMDK